MHEHDVRHLDDQHQRAQLRPLHVGANERLRGGGKARPYSLVARSGVQLFTPASEDSELAQLFKAEAAPAPARPAFYTADGDQGAQNFGRSDGEGAGERSHYFIVADMKSRSITGLEEEIFNFGSAYQILPQAWILASDKSINLIRNTLTQKLGKLDMLFIVDASHDKAAWFNFGPEADSRIRRIWQKQVEPATQQRAAG